MAFCGRSLFIALNSHLEAVLLRLFSNVEKLASFYFRGRFSGVFRSTGGSERLSVKQAIQATNPSIVMCASYWKEKDYFYDQYLLIILFEIKHKHSNLWRVLDDQIHENKSYRGNPLICFEFIRGCVDAGCFFYLPRGMFHPFSHLNDPPSVHQERSNWLITEVMSKMGTHRILPRDSHIRQVWHEHPYSCIEWPGTSRFCTTHPVNAIRSAWLLGRIIELS